MVELACLLRGALARALLMLAEAGVPSLLGLFLEVNAGVLATAYAALAAHEVTAFRDVAYAEERRRVTPTEQHVHSYLEVGPLMAVVLLTVLPYLEEFWRCYRTEPTVAPRPEPPSQPPRSLRIPA